MKLTDQEKWVIEQYEQDEQMMVLIYAQWCVNHQLNAVELYKKAYPNQMENKALQDALEKTVPKKESEDITIDVLFHVLQVFGNDDLAFVIQEALEQKRKD